LNEIGLNVIGVLVRGTVFATLGLAICAMLRRRGPSASAFVALATLVGMAGVSALGALPWPHWWNLEAGDRAPALASRPLPAAPRTDVNQAANVDVSPATNPPVEPALKVDALANALRDLGKALVNPAPAERQGWGWPAWVALAALAGIALGIGRFAVGLLAVAMLRIGSRPVEDQGLVELARRVREELGITRNVDLRVASGLATAATVGWLRPAILLPEDWAGWDDRERRVVLAHELAHIHRNDYLSGLWAQLSVALHYYHPMAHWLSRRLRLDQELAADAWGAQLSGGNRAYLAALARLALRNDPRPVGWPARSFRPGRGTFLRRIEMLRDAKELRPSPLPRSARLVALGTLVLAGLALAGLRGPGTLKTVEAALAPQAPGVIADLGFIPADAAAVASFRPADLMARPELKQFLESQDQIKQMQAHMNITLADIEQITVVWTYGESIANRPRGPMVPEPAGFIVRATKAQDWKALLTKLLNEVREDKIGDVTTYFPGHGGERVAFAAPDDRTIIYGDPAILRRMLTARPGATERAAWGDAWKAVKRGQIALAFDVSWIAGKLERLGPPPGNGAVSPLAPFSPLWEKSQAYAVGLDWSKTLSVDAVATCGSEKDAKGVADTLKATLLLAKNSLESVRGAAAAAKTGHAALPVGLIDAAAPFLDKANISAEGTTVHLATSSDLQLVTLLAPAVQAQRTTARRAQSVNNMKQIGLAMHNYASVHGHFPPPVVIGPDGKTPHSWRVEILPYLEQQPLYNAYRMDEPWDGPNNRKLIDLMPATFVSPESRSKSVPSYYVLTGKHTIFNGTKGTDFAQITDGTSNTIAAVEAVRDIPWTKPEDIPFDPPGDNILDPAVIVPQLGGLSADGFNALFADGSVRFIKNSINPITLKALFTRDGGEVISSSSF
jgi:prepilin-type processing-associated H-X9-DG protein